MKTFMLVPVMMVAMVSLAFAQDGAKTAAPENANLVSGLISALLGGAMAVFVGWGKNRDAKTGEMQKFEVQHAWPTLVIGGVVGLVAFWLKKTPQDLVSSLEASPIYAGIIFAVEAGWKLIWRNSVPMVREALSAVKSGKNPTTPPSNPS